MEITETRIKLMDADQGGNARLIGFASITIDDMFVVRDLKIIDGAKGIFVAMPSRKLTDRCHSCGTKNHLRARFCNQCGSRLDENRALRDVEGHAKLHADVAHPINVMGRAKIQTALLDAYADEVRLSKLPGYVSRYDDYGIGEPEDCETTPTPEVAMPGRAAPPIRRRQPVTAA